MIEMHLFEQWEKCITRCNMCLTGGPSGKKRTEEWKENAQRYWLENFSGLMEGMRKQSIFWSKESKSILQIHCSEMIEYQRGSEKQPEMKDILACKGITTRFREDFSTMPWKFRRYWNYILQDLRENNPI